MGYQKEVTQRARAILDSRRSNAVETALAHKSEVYRKVPEVYDVDLKIQHTGASIARSILLSPDETKELINKLANENLELQNQRTSLLVSNGFPADYLKTKYTCDACEDTGYIGINRCLCLGALLQQEAFALLSSVSDGASSSFESFRLDYYPNTPLPNSGIIPRRRMEDIWTFTKQYSKEFNKNSPSILMLGHTGLGKTHLSLAIAWEVTAKGFGVVYTPVQRLIDRLEALKFSYDSDKKELYAQHMQSALECDLLVLDDLGTEFSTSFTTSVLYSIVNTRLVENRPTIVNTNLTPKELEEKYTQRMASRLTFGYKPLQFFGEDVRLIRRKEKVQKA